VLPNDTETVSGQVGSFIISGTITFRLYSPANSNCSGTADYTEEVTVSGNGTYSTTNKTFVVDTVNPAHVGTWRWLVQYSGDSNYAGVTTGPCGVEQFTIDDDINSPP